MAINWLATSFVCTKKTHESIVLGNSEYYNRILRKSSNITPALFSVSELTVESRVIFNCSVF